MKTYSYRGIGKTTAEMTFPYDGDTYLDWDFDELWSTDDENEINDGYPYLSWQVPTDPTTASNPSPQDEEENVSVTLEILSWDYFDSE